MYKYIPNNTKIGKKKILAIAAHQDDIELMAFSGISKSIIEEEYSFIGVVCTNGKSSPRIGKYKNMTNDDMILERRKEQCKASEIGRYEACYLLDYDSFEVKKSCKALKKDLKSIIDEYKPDIIYTHNKFDKHETHLGVVFNVIEFLKTIRDEYKPKKFIGCEVWRDLDWLDDLKKVILDCGLDEQKQLDILNVFESQVVGGKRYDLAGVGRRYANATFFESHSVHNIKMTNYGIDLYPLIQNKSLSLKKFAKEYLKDFERECLLNIKNFK